MAKNVEEASLVIDGSLRKDIREGNFNDLFIVCPASRCSSSPQPSSDEFIDIISRISTLSPNIEKDKIIIFDLRKERHLHIANIPVVVASDEVEDNDDEEDEDEEVEFDVGKIQQVTDSSQIIAAEGSLAGLSRSSSTISIGLKFRSNQSYSSLESLHQPAKFDFAVSDALNEQQVLLNCGIKNYQRVPVVNNGLPEDTWVDIFITKVLSLEPDYWVHFHCHGGKGRSAIFMFIYDALRRIQYPDTPQGEYNPRNNRKLVVKSKGKTSAAQLRRIRFVDLFTTYLAKIQDDLATGKIANYGQRQSWVEWRQEHSPRIANRVTLTFI